MTVTVVIPNWNGKNLLHMPLRSLAEQTEKSFTTVVVDNASADGSTQYLREQWPEVQIIALTRNVGFAAAVNSGIRTSCAEFIALLNNDVELDRNWMHELVSAFRAHPEAASATGKVFNFADRVTLQSAGDFLRRDSGFGHRGAGELDVGQFDRRENIFGASAGAAMYRREAFGCVGLFDEDFFAYAEDVDWSLRAHLRGLSCLFVPSAVAYHVGGATSSRIPNLTRYLSTRNSIWLVAKNYPKSALMQHGHAVVFFWLRSLVRSAHDGWFRVFMRAWIDAARMLPLMLRKRKAIQESRSTTVGSLDAILASRSASGPFADALSRLGRRDKASK